MSDFPWLTTLVLLPVIGAAVVAVLPRAGSLGRYVGLGVSIATAALVAGLAVTYNAGDGMQFTEQHTWIGALGAHWALGVDGLGLCLLALTALLVPLVLLASWHDADRFEGGSANTQVALMLLLEGLALGVFAATDVFLFYVLFEATLIPAYFLIGGFGGAGRGAAALKFLIYMLLGGLVMLASVVGLYAVSAQQGEPSYLVSDLAQLDFGTWQGRWLWLGFFIAFAIKAPLFPVHTWLPDTTGAATPGVSVLLVCVLDKIGTFGMLRFCLGIFPEASKWATPVVIALAVISILYGALIAIGQSDLLRLIGLTSLSHFGFIVLGIFVMNTQGQSGAILYMVNHGIATAGLFLTAGYLIRRTGTARISEMLGYEKVTPVLAGLFLVAGMATLGLPGLAPFASEFLVLVGSFAYQWWVGALSVLAIVLAAMYILMTYRRIFTGPHVTVSARSLVGTRDLNLREVLAVAPIAVLLVVLGFFPQPVLDVVNPYVADTLAHVGAHDEPPAVDASEGGHE